MIRINKLPLAGHAQDVGSRTDVYFAGAVSEDVDRMVESGYDMQFLWGGHRICQYDDGDCPFVDLVFNHGVSACGEPFAQKYPRWKPGWFPPKSSFTVAHQSDALFGAVLYAMKTYLNRKRATSGLQAFFTFAPLCRTMTLIGFSGMSTVDGHRLSKGTTGVHDIAAEHRLLDWMIDGQSFSDMHPLRNVSFWERRREILQELFDPEPRCGQEAFKLLERCILALQSEGRLKKDKTQ